MASESRRYLRFEPLESKLPLTSQLIDAEVQPLHHDPESGWFVGNENLPVGEFDVVDHWDPVTTGDFTADGITDVLGQSDGEWWLKVNDGTQLFGVPWGERLPFNADILGKHDFNEDGWLDILAWDANTGVFWLARNSPDGFLAERWGEFSTTVTWSSFFLRDFNNDGLIDVLARELQGGNWWLATNHGDGFRNQHWGRLPDYSWQNVIDGDFDGDQFGDIAARAADNTWWVWRGTDSGFLSSQYWGNWRIRGNWDREVWVADFNNDERDDLLGKTNDNRLWVGSSGESEFLTSVWSEPWTGLATSYDVRVLDVDADGDPDLAGRTDGDRFWVARNTGQDLEFHAYESLVGNAEFVDYVTDFRALQSEDVSGFFPSVEADPADQSMDADASVAELNRAKYSAIQTGLRAALEGLIDAPVQLLRYPVYGRWSFGSENPSILVDRDHAAEWIPIVSGDFTADGVTDVLGLTDVHRDLRTGRVDGEWWLKVNDGTQLFGVPWGERLPAGAEVMGTADLNDDGLLDVLARNSMTGEFWVSRNSPTGFITERWGQFSPKVQWDNFFVRDFDDDGLIDVMARETSGNWWLAKNHGAGFHNYHWGKLPDFDWLDIVDGDFDGDQLGDVAARAPDNTWWVWRGTASGLRFSEYWGHWKFRHDWYDVAAGDFNGDGRDDLIGSTVDDRLWVGLANGSEFETSSWSTAWYDSANWSDVRVIDVDTDGLADLVGRRIEDNTFWVAKSTGRNMALHNWERGSTTDGFVDYVENFVVPRGIDVSRFFPGTVEPFDGFLTSDGRLVSDQVRVSLNEQGKIVISGNGQELVGIDLKSPSGSLVPIAGGDESASAAPFAFLLSNDPDQITLGNLTSRVKLAGDLVLDIGWDATAGKRDLRVWFGAEPDVIVVEAIVEDPLSVLDESDVFAEGSDGWNYVNELRYNRSQEHRRGT